MRTNQPQTVPSRELSDPVISPEMYRLIRLEVKSDSSPSPYREHLYIYLPRVCCENSHTGGNNTDNEEHEWIIKVASKKNCCGLKKRLERRWVSLPKLCLGTLPEVSYQRSKLDALSRFLRQVFWCGYRLKASIIVGAWDRLCRRNAHAT